MWKSLKRTTDASLDELRTTDSQVFDPWFVVRQAKRPWFVLLYPIIISNSLACRCLFPEFTTIFYNRLSLATDLHGLLQTDE